MVLLLVAVLIFQPIGGTALAKDSGIETTSPDATADIDESVLRSVGPVAETADTSQTDEDSREVSRDHAVDVTHQYSLINTTSGAVFTLAPGKPLDDVAVPAGEYRVRNTTHRSDHDSQTSYFRARVDSDGSVTRIDADSDATIGTLDTDDSIEIRATIGYDYDDPYSSDGTVNVSVAAVNTTGAQPTPVGDVPISVTVSGPNGVENETEVTRNVTSRSDGAVAVPIDLSELPDGPYDIAVTSPETDSTTNEYFVTGPTANVYPQFTDHVEINRTTTVAVSLTERGEPIANRELNVSISKPNGTTEIKTLTTDADGFATFQFNPDQKGTYGINVEKYPGTASRLTAVDVVSELKTDSERFSTHLPAGGTVQLSGFLFDNGQPFANEEIIVRIVNESAGEEPVENISTTTDSLGQYAVPWETPENPDADFEAHLHTADGERIPHDGGRINLQSTSDDEGGGGDGPEANLNADIESISYRNVVAPGDDATATVTASENGSAVSNVTVDYTLVYGYDVVAATGSVTTNESGQATISVPVAADAPDGTSLELRTRATINGSTVRDTEHGDLQQYLLDEERLGEDVPGADVGFEVRFVDPETGNGVAGVPMTVAAETFDAMQPDIFSTGSAVSGSDGRAAVNATLPSLATREYLYGPSHPYFDGGFPTEFIDGYSVSFNGIEQRQEVSAGETISLNYTTTSPDTTNAVVMFTTYEDGLDPATNAKTVREGESFNMTIPSVSSNADYDISIRTINGSGVTASASNDLDVLATGNAAPTADAGSDVTASPNETVALDGTGSSDPDGDSLSYQWQQVEGPSVAIANVSTATPTFTAPDVNSSTTLGFELTVSDGNVTDTSTVTVTVTPPLEPIGDFDQPPTDVDGDGHYMDITGDGNVTVSDVQAMFDNREDPTVQTNVDQFDFNADGEVDIVDVQRLFVEYAG